MTQIMNFSQAFEILEIEPTSDRKVIKRAYAQMVKRYHPEEHPQEWQRVHDAYEYAMGYAGRSKEQNIVISEEQLKLHEEQLKLRQEQAKQEMQAKPKEEQVKLRQEETKPREEQVKPREEQTKQQEEQPKQERELPKIKIPPKIKHPLGTVPEPEAIIIPQFSEEEEAEIDFGNVENIARQNQEQQKREREKLLSYVMDLLTLQANRRIQRSKDWEEVLYMPEVHVVRLNATFLYRLGDCLDKIRINKKTYQVIRAFLEDVHRELVSSIFDETVGSSSMDAWEMAAQGAIKAFRGKTYQERRTQETRQTTQEKRSIGKVFFSRGGIICLVLLVLRVAARYERIQNFNERIDNYKQQQIVALQEEVEIRDFDVERMNEILEENETMLKQFEALQATESLKTEEQAEEENREETEQIQELPDENLVELLKEPEVAEETMLQIVKDKYGDAVLGEESVFDANTKEYNWRILDNPIPYKFANDTGYKERDVAACYMVEILFMEHPDVITYLNMEEFGIESGEYEIWMNDGDGYRTREVAVVETSDEEENREYDNEDVMEYPYEKDGILYIRVKACDTIGYASNAHSVVVIKKQAEE